MDIAQPCSGVEADEHALQFIAGRRPPKLQLWEALMRVDPTLSEKKAKEAARLAQGGFTA